MPHFETDNARLYFEDTGQGEAILVNHGLSESTLYWSLPGITDALSAHYRVVSMDMRGHGRSQVTGEPAGFDPETIGNDLGSLADHLGIERFHVLSHATGGMAALRYAMAHSGRLLSLMLTDTGSATAFGDEQSAAQVRELFAASFEGKDWETLFALERQHQEPFFTRLDAAARPHQAWAMVQATQRLSSPDLLARFCREFYTDLSAHEERLRAIRCPTLVLLGEHDKLFVEPSQLLAREIPGAKHVVMQGLGHMTAIEAPERLATELLGFLAR